MANKQTDSSHITTELSRELSLFHVTMMGVGMMIGAGVFLGIGNSIGIPHARTDAVKEFVIAFGISPQGIEFDSLDKNPVKFIFLMGTPRSKGLNSYLKLLAHLTRLANKKEFQEVLLKARTSQEILKEFRKFEG